MELLHIFPFLALFASFCIFTPAHANVQNKNPSFELGAKDWNIIIDPPSIGTVTFPKNKARSRSGAKGGLAVFDLGQGAVFPSRLYVGQTLTLLPETRYRIVVWARIDAGTNINGQQGAIVSTFCEQTQADGGGYIGQDTTINEATGPYKTENYRKIVFDIIGDGKPWSCFLQILAQPTRERIIASVDDFRILKQPKPVTSPNLSKTTRIVDGAFNVGQLKVPRYPQPNRISLPERGWYEYYYYSIAKAPKFVGAGKARSISLELPPRGPNREPLEFTGVVQKVPLRAGQRYELCIDYKRIAPLPAQVPGETVFNYYVRLPTNFGNDALLRNSDDGLLLGRVDVKPKRELSGTSSVQFIAPKGGSNFQVVLKLSAYGNERVAGRYSMSFDNAKLVPIRSTDDIGCRK